jgi:creatinine amidohydrolase
LYKVRGQRQETPEVTKPAHVMAEMTWPEFKAARSSIDLAIIPLGATEQHGPHGTYAVDTGRADGFGRRLAERLYPRAIVVPALPYGISEHHMAFPGTVSLSGPTYIKVLEELVESLYRHGFRKFLFPNAHGGNKPALDMLMSQITARYGREVKAAWFVISRMAAEVYAAETHSPIMGHACEGEMSQSMVLAPSTVRQSALSKAELHFTPADWKRRKDFHEAQFWDEISASGDLGDATKANPELGEKIVATALDNLEAILVDF